MLKLVRQILWVKVLPSIVWILILCLPLHAQAPRITADLLSVQDGLPSYAITSLIQDHLGYIWMGTDYGLARYDGYEFVNYTPNFKKVDGLQGEQINFIYENDQGNLWLGSNRGLHYFDRGQESFQNFTLDSSGWNVHYIFEDLQGDIWTVSDRENYLHRWDSDSGSFTQMFQGAEKTPVQVGKINSRNASRAPVWKDTAGKIWIGTIGKGLLHYDRSNDQFEPAPLTAGNSINDTIYSLLQDRQQLWLGTPKGLIRYDLETEQIRPFPSGDPAQGKEVFDLRKDLQGNIWLQERFRVIKVDPSSETSKVYLQLPILDIDKKPALFQRAFFVYLGEGPRGFKYWFHPFNKDQIYQYNPQKDEITAYTIDFPEKNQYWAFDLWMSHFLSGLVDHTGITWIGFGQEILKIPLVQERFNTHQLKYYSIGKGEIDLDKWGNFWISTSSGGELYKFDPKNLSVSRMNDYVPQIFSEGHGPNLLIDKQDNMWWGQYPSSGLFRFPIEASSFMNLALGKPSKASSIEHRLMLLPEFAVDGDLNTRWGSDYFAASEWIEVDLEAVHHIDHLVLSWNASFANVYEVLLSDDGQNWRTAFSTKNAKGQIEEIAIGQRSRYVRLILKDRNSAFGFSIHELEIWGSLPVITPYHSKAYETLGLPSGTIYGIYQDSKDIVWVATRAGIARYGYDDNRFEPITLSDGSGIDLYWAHFFEDRTGRMWILGEGSIYAVSPGGEYVEQFVHKINENSTYVSHTQVFEDSYGYLWFFDRVNGVYRYHPVDGKGKLYLPDQRILAVFEDSKGQIWLGSTNNGLLLLNTSDGSSQQYSVDEGLSFRQVNAINEDNQGRLWVGTSDGLSCFYPELEQFENFTKEDGLFGDHINTLVKDNQGKIMAGGFGGFSFFDPNTFRLDSSRPKVVIAELKLSNQTVRPGDKESPLTQSISETKAIRLAHHQNDIGLEYTALHYYRSDENQYQVQMEGLDTTWMDLGNQRTVNYLGLSPGNYTFKVRGSNADGVWTEAPAVLKITILPPWWKTNGAYLLWVLLVVSGIYSLYQYNLRRQLAIEENRRIKELNHLKSRLYTNITHEFRTPLTVIMGMTEQLAESPQQKDYQDRVKQGLHLIQRNSRNLLRLINQLLDLSKLDSGKLKVNMIQGDIVAYLQYLTESFYSMAEDKGVRLTCYSEDDSLLMDYDEEKIQHIVYNILSNAIKFTPKKGKVIFHIRKKEHLEDDILELKVKDTGTGIAPDQLPHIFERFYQVDDSSTRASEGTGIGLASTNELLKLMQGSIQVESTLGVGTTFLIQLPITRKAPFGNNIWSSALNEPHPINQSKRLPTQSTTSELAQNPDNPVLLIIEDNPDVVLYIRKLLEQDYRIHTAENGQNGLEIAFELIPDIIISDVMMPVKDGYEVCNTLKQDERTSHIPIILLTARAEQEDRLKGLQYGADAYLTKPFKKSELKIRLERLIEVRQKLQARYANQTLVAAEIPEDESIDSESIFLEKLAGIILNHLGDPEFGVPQLANYALLSQMQVYRKLRALTGKTPSQFIRSIRLQKGKELLLNTDLTISEIAYEVGFSDPSYFSRTFHGEFNISPRGFRK